jgi:hypothetical protein
MLGLQGCDRTVSYRLLSLKRAQLRSWRYRRLNIEPRRISRWSAVKSVRGQCQHSYVFRIQGNAARTTPAVPQPLGMAVSSRRRERVRDVSNLILLQTISVNLLDEWRGSAFVPLSARPLCKVDSWLIWSYECILKVGRDYFREVPVGYNLQATLKDEQTQLHWKALSSGI